MLHTLGYIELCLAAFPGLIGLLFWYFHKTRNDRQKHHIIAYIFWGLGGIFLIAALITPPDLISTIVLSVPAGIVFLAIMIRKYN